MGVVKFYYSKKRDNGEPKASFNSPDSDTTIGSEYPVLFAPVLAMQNCKRIFTMFDLIKGVPRGEFFTCFVENNAAKLYLRLLNVFRINSIIFFIVFMGYVEKCNDHFYKHFCMISFKERAVGNAVNGTCWLHIYLEGKDKIANPNLNKLLSKNGIASLLLTMLTIPNLHLLKWSWIDFQK